ncbi:MAG: PIN domain-containing protein [Rhizomicrobium sp.]
MKVALDTNILVYAEGIDDKSREAIATEVTSILPEDMTFLSAGVLAELFNVLVRRGRTREDAASAARAWEQTFSIVPTTQSLVLTAIDLAVRHRFKIWDALILAAAAEAGCGLLISEDFQDGFVWNGVTVANPFKSPLHPLLASVLRR